MPNKDVAKNREYHQKYYQVHKEHMKQTLRQWKKNNLYQLTLSSEIWRNLNHEKVVFRHIKDRTTNPKCKRYSYYGGRGIKNYLRSEKDIIDAIGKWPGKGYSIDRIDNNGHYEKGNIRWATQTQQNLNRRTRKS